MATRKIEPKDGAEVCVGPTGQICIKQVSGLGEEALIIMHRDEITELIEHLQSAYQEALDFVPES